jgi:SAM-dependent methyltransferase
MKKKIVVIDEHIRVHQMEAPEFSQSTLASESGAVSPERWAEAQRFEFRTWMTGSGRRVLSDRNEEHSNRFDHFSVLRNQNFPQVLEIGCGPFTNLRLVLEQCRAEGVTLLDPLLAGYLTHPFCAYRKGRLGGVFKEFPSFAAFLHPFGYGLRLLNAYRVGGWLGRPVHLLPEALETTSVQGPFDLIVMINVLEHCQNASTVFEKIKSLSKKGTVFIFHDRLYSHEEIHRLNSEIYDAGHPLRIEDKVLVSFLRENFKTLYWKEFVSERFFHEVKIPDHDLYFIGQCSHEAGSPS